MKNPVIEPKHPRFWRAIADQLGSYRGSSAESKCEALTPIATEMDSGNTP
jgi:hypothetical protein